MTFSLFVVDTTESTATEKELKLSGRAQKSIQAFKANISQSQRVSRLIIKSLVKGKKSLTESFESSTAGAFVRNKKNGKRNSRLVSQKNKFPDNPFAIWKAKITFFATCASMWIYVACKVYERGEWRRKNPKQPRMKSENVFLCSETRLLGHRNEQNGMFRALTTGS